MVVRLKLIGCLWDEGIVGQIASVVPAATRAASREESEGFYMAIVKALRTFAAVPEPV